MPLLNAPLNILTIATGKKLYLDMATNLARSFYLWNPNNKIDFYLATDQPQLLPCDIKHYVKVIHILPGELGEGFSPKLHLDKLTPAGRTVFIDSDCLIYKNMDFVFDKFNGHKVSVVGNYISTGEWFGNVDDICKQFGIEHMPKFNGGIYYLEKGAVAEKVYDTARMLEKKYDEIGFTRLRNRPNDEVLMALAMELNQQKPVPDDGSILGEFVNFQSGIKSDLINGVAELYNDPANANYQQNWHLTSAKPAIVHFLGHHNQLMPYVKEAKQLKYLFANKWPKNLASLATALQITLPRTTIAYLKKAFRPVYHFAFGARKVKVSERIVAHD